MDEKFEIATDPIHCLLRITMHGHWDVDTVDRYKTAVRRAGQTLIAGGCARGDLIALVDARASGAQSQDVIADYKINLGGDELAPQRLATLVSSALFRRQVERIGISNQRLFTEEAEALAWLLEPSDDT